jgi:O-antigen ligase
VKSGLLNDPHKFARILWGAALLTIPVTSFRWFPFLGEGTIVRPLALYPLALLLPLLLILYWQGRMHLAWPDVFVPLLAFILFLFASTAFGAMIDPIPLRGQEYAGRAIRAVATVIIGVIFFVCAVWMNRDENYLRYSLKWLFAGLGLDMAWSGLQAVTFYTGLLEKEMVTHWQLAFSMRELIRTNRISGLAYEPAWLAGQLATIYIPILCAAVLTNFRLTRWKWLEPVLLGISLLLLLATYSRGGLLIMVAAAGLTFLLMGRDAMHSTWKWFVDGFRSRRMAAVSLRLGMFVVIAGVLAGTFLFLGQKNFFRRLWEIDANSLSEYMIDINAGARGAYSSAALAAFHAHPWTGVGAGASGFYIYQNMPDWALTTVPEIAKQLSPENRLYPNPKNLYVRLLAETGLLGFCLFLALQFHLLGDILSLLRRETLFRFAATAGLFAWLAITFYNFTQDSLTTPNLWLVPGMLVGLASTTSKREKI